MTAKPCDYKTGFWNGMSVKKNRMANLTANGGRASTQDRRNDFSRMYAPTILSFGETSLSAATRGDGMCADVDVPHATGSLRGVSGRWLSPSAKGRTDNIP